MKSYKILKDYKENKELNIEKIVKEYSGYVYTIIKNMSNQELKSEDIEEIIADTFFILWKKQTSLDNETKITAYLAGIVKNLLKQKARNTHWNEDIADYENSLVSKDDINEIYEEQEKTKIMEKALQDMSEEDNKVFKLYYYAGKKVKQIAKELNITEVNVKTKLYRIRKRMKKDLIEMGYQLEK